MAGTLLNFGFIGTLLASGETIRVALSGAVLQTPKWECHFDLANGFIFAWIRHRNRAWHSGGMRDCN
jgi:hypothetical protein